MSLYSTFKYGTDVKYGVGVTTGNLLWSFIVLWDGVWWSPNEAYRRMTSLTVRRGRQNMLATGGAGLESFGVGEAVGIFDNEDGRFDPFNIDSPLYPNVAPGKFARIEVRDDSTGTDYGVMRGVIADIQPVRQGGKNAVRIVVHDGLQWLKDAVINLGLQESLQKDSPPTLITGKADWPTSEWSLTVAADTALQTYYWAWNQGAYEALDEWNRAEWAVAFHGRDGIFYWNPRTYSQNRTFNISQDEILTDIGRPQPWESIRTIVKTHSSPKILDAVGAILWQLQTVPAIADGETFAIEPVFKYSDWQPCGDSMVFTFTVNQAAGGGGADLSGDCVLVSDSDVGEGARLWLTNNSGVDGFITDLRATGDAIYAPSVDIREVEDTEAKATYGSRTLMNTSRWVEDTEYAQTLATWLLDNLKESTMLPIIQMEDRLVNQFNPDLYDKVVLRAPKLRLRKVFRVGSIEHQWLNENGQSVKTTAQLEQYLVKDVDVRDEAHIGCLVYNHENQGVNHESQRFINFRRKLHDTDLTNDDGRITIPAGLSGYYRIWATIRWESNATGQRYMRLWGDGADLLALATQASPGAVAFTQHLEITLYVSAGTFLQIAVYQNSGVALNIEFDATPYFPLLGAQFLGA